MKRRSAAAAATSAAPSSAAAKGGGTGAKAAASSTGAAKTAPPPPPPPSQRPLRFASLRRALARAYAPLLRARRDNANDDDDLSDLAVRALEPVAVVFCAGSVLAAIALYSWRVTPEIFARFGAATGIAHTTLGLSCCYAFGRSYYYLLTTPPGNTRSIGRETLEAARAKKGDPSAFWRHCDLCNLDKPPLAHHCSVCNSCVLRADHHCLWFANCLGFGNYRHFATFLFYLSAGCGYACATTYAVFSGEAVRDPWTFRYLIVLALASGGLSLALAALMAWHACCLFNGMGTLEMMDRVLGWHGEEEEEERKGGQTKQQPPPHVSVKSLQDYPFNLGVERNVRLAFDLDDGRGFWWLRWLRVHGAPRKGDGLSFPVQERRQL